MKTETKPRAKFLKDYRAPDFQITHTKLLFALDPSATRVSAELSVERTQTSAPDAPLVLDGARLQHQSVAVDGRVLEGDDVVLTATTLTIPNLPDRCTVTTEVVIDPSTNTELEGLFACDPILATQCEATGFRAITWFLDRPDVLSRYTVTIEADKATYPVLLSNGNCIEQAELDDGRHRAVWEDPYLKPSYLFALVAGELSMISSTHTTPSGRKVSLELYAEPKEADRLEFALESLRQSMIWDEQAYGREYDLDRYLVVSVSSFNMGAMENKGLNVFNSSLLLATKDIATDESHMLVRDVVAHEYFHNWTGNRITCRDWFQLSLKEGLTVFREHQFSEDMNDPAIARVEQVRGLKAFQFAEDAGPTAHPVRPESYVEMNNFYTATVYEKGGEVIRMMRTIVSPEGFARGMDTYFDRHDGQAVTIEDFVTAIEDGSGKSLSAFRQWYSQAGTPTLTVREQFEDGTLTVNFGQHTAPTPKQPNKQALPIPIRLSLLGAGTPKWALDGLTETSPNVFVLDGEQGTMRVSGLTERPVVSLLQGFSAPVNLDHPLSPPALATIMRDATDAFARWDAGQRLLNMAFDAGTAGAPDSAGNAALDAFCDVLRDTKLDDRLLPEWLSLPGVDTLAARCEPLDVEAAVAAYDALRRGVAQRLESMLPAWAKATEPAGPWVFDKEAVALRRLHGACLILMAVVAPESALEAATRLYDTTDNLTDRVNALSAIKDIDAPAREALFARMREDWPSESLVMDHWFRLQASSQVAGTPAGIEQLMALPDYDPRRPNRVRAVVGSFARANFRNVYTRAGIALMAQQCIAMDRINAQLAARMVKMLTQHPNLADPHREWVREAMRQIVDRDDVSPNVREIVDAVLGD